jgi:hypothetical protein
MQTFYLTNFIDFVTLLIWLPVMGLIYLFLLIW